MTPLQIGLDFEARKTDDKSNSANTGCRRRLTVWVTAPSEVVPTSRQRVSIPSQLTRNRLAAAEL